jgi:hypothetical protein
MKSKVHNAKVLILTVITFLLLAFPSGARADPIDNYQLSSSGSFVDPCTGHLIDYSDNLHVLATHHIDAAGGQGSDVSFNLDDYSAVDTVTGAKLQLQENGQALLGSGPFDYKLNFPASGTVEITQDTTLRLEEQGLGRTLEVTLKFHITVNANGTATATISETDVACK